jgi:hypothetical protein
MRGHLFNPVELVTVAVERRQPVTGLRPEMQFCAQAGRVGVRRPRRHVAPARPPHFHDVRTRYGARHVGEQQPGEAEFVRREQNPLIRETHAQLRCIEPIFAETLGRARANRASARQHFHAGGRFE